MQQFMRAVDPPGSDRARAGGAGAHVRDETLYGKGFHSRVVQSVP